MEKATMNDWTSMDLIYVLPGNRQELRDTIEDGDRCLEAGMNPALKWAKGQKFHDPPPSHDDGGRMIKSNLCVARKMDNKEERSRHGGKHYFF